MNKALLILLAIILLLPLWFVATGSLTDMKGIMVMPPNLLPKRPSFDNYVHFFGYPLGLWAMNTVIIALGSALLSVTVSCSVGYAFAFFNWPLKKWLWLLLLAGIMIPRMSMMIPRFVVMRKLALLSTYQGMMLSGALNPIGIYLARTYFETVPRALLDAARIDGANEFQILGRVVVPISRPIVTCLALFAGSAALHDYVWQSLVLRSDKLWTLLLGLLHSVVKEETFASTASQEFMLNPLGRKFAASMILIIPLLAIFFAASRYFTSALGGAIKE